ncbi:Peroxisomal membrane protein PEX16 [Seminavis robusta]|uniref:Peroxisomal membrane protein PEX16 n=1 Tax=Seminavis robusta TaxID=568900 RepID=A0A9N8HW54_9STRA|nr:Peroxisomal membrane protein PEX16 [Seminavis robusta]|eukprot:Sro2091_g314010.1 Peroxisomal membrane protein PEX16 (404) ;mRNA; r:6777-7988
MNEPSSCSESSDDETTNEGPVSASLLLWEAYRSFVHRHRVSLELLDAGISRILFWSPTSGEQQKRREVFYGILSLHRLAMDTALQQQQDDAQQEDFGTTVKPNQTTTRQEDSVLPSPTAIRVSLTIIQCLLPSILELASSDDETTKSNRQARVRLQIERVKFALRLTLLGSYWKQLLPDQTQERDMQASSWNTKPMSIGILTDGGLFHGAITSTAAENIPTVQQEDMEWEKLHYVGKRTGRKVTRRTMQGGDSLYTSSSLSSQSLSLALLSPQIHNNLRLVSVILGELLYAYRPLFWASAETVSDPASYRSWLLSMVMDVVSLRMAASQSSVANQATQQELRRRKMRLLLYLLRGPFWNDATGPATDRVEAVLDKVPLLGRLVSTYLRDWLWYMKHPYVSEEG